MVGRYRVIERVGAGGMGVVYKAIDLQLGRDVALKLLASPMIGDSSCSMMCALLLNEARVMARLSHPNLMTVYDVGEHDGCVFLAMEYIRGTTLRRWAAAPDRSWRDRLEILLEAGNGLADAHRAGVVHRDFKPDNVLVSDNGRVLVGDFGLARSAAEWQKLGSGPRCCGGAEQTGALIAATARSGTPAYMALEQQIGGTVDERSDLFAFAVSAWELTFGALPFAPGEPDRRLAALAEGPPAVRDPRDATEPISPILSRALAANPGARYPALTDLLSRLRVAARPDQ